MPYPAAPDRRNALPPPAMVEPIGVARCRQAWTYDAPRQPGAGDAGEAVLELLPNHNLEQALSDLDGFSHIWIIFLFDRNRHWKPKVKPPRGDAKRGLFATRAPYRPNPIGISAVELLGIRGLSLTIGPHDLLDGTPILDIKPYLPYADSFPTARTGWLEALPPSEPEYAVRIAPLAAAQLRWLDANHGPPCLEDFLLRTLACRPTVPDRKRVRPLDNAHEIAYRTWRAVFRCDPAKRTVTVISIGSGYAPEALRALDDPHRDKHLHRAFREQHQEIT